MRRPARPPQPSARRARRAGSVPPGARRGGAARPSGGGPPRPRGRGRWSVHHRLGEDHGPGGDPVRPIGSRARTPHLVLARRPGGLRAVPQGGRGLREALPRGADVGAARHRRRDHRGRGRYVRPRASCSGWAGRRWCSGRAEPGLPARHRPGAEDRPAHLHHRRAQAGGHHQGQRARARGRRGLLQRLRPGARRGEGRRLHHEHLAPRADHPALGAGPARPGRHAVQARRSSTRSCERSWTSHRPLGHQGDGRGDQGGRAPRQHEARHGQAGRGRARAASQGHRGRRRAPGLREARAGRRRIIGSSPRPSSCATSRR